jgi:hypothetical protein
MAQRVLALTSDGKLTYCVAPPNERGKGKCNHVFHQKEGESNEEFIKRVEPMMGTDNFSLDESKKEAKNEENPITLDEIKSIRNRIEEICGRKDITLDNLSEVIKSLPPEKQQEIVKIGFDASKYFAFPISEDNFDEETFKTDIYFSNMHKYHIGAKENHINEILNSIGDTVKEKGAGHVNGNYWKGLTDDEYWDLQYSTRVASVNKTVSISAPGEISRLAFYGLSDTIMMEDCKNDGSTGILTCDAPGGVCEKCMNKAGKHAKNILSVLKKGCGGDVTKVHIGGLVSTNISEPITQSYLNAIHSANDPNANQHKIIVNTYKGFSSSPILVAANKGKTTAERRQLLYEGLKKAYADQKIDIEDWNLQIVAKKMTSYKINPVTKKIEFVEDGELCDIINFKSLGNRNNIFKKAALGSARKNLTKAQDYKVDPFDAFNDLMIGTDK